ncbi:MAG: hypothetical protein EHM78_13980 [Myxococcaceae bacterium]|nr:MAG: hypothetical protein EHM78_13980 [Myxococcaceae bacterium]
MNRREVLFRVGGLLLALPASRVLLACGGDTGMGPDSLRFISSSDLGHTHFFTLQLTEITSPPAAGISRQTSNDLSHTHTVTLTEADLDSINAGNTVTITTSNDDNHTHTFAFRKS